MAPARCPLANPHENGGHGPDLRAASPRGSLARWLCRGAHRPPRALRGPARASSGLVLLRLVDGLARKERRPVGEGRWRGVRGAEPPSTHVGGVEDLEAGVLLRLRRRLGGAGALRAGGAGCGGASGASRDDEPVGTGMAARAFCNAKAVDTVRGHAGTSWGGPQGTPPVGKWGVTLRAGIGYDLENVFDWRSGPRRGLTPVPIPIHHALTGPR
jgi:hypothetical protein